MLKELSVQHQRWGAMDRYVFFNEYASVQLETYIQPRGHAKVDCCIHSLFVNNEARKQGYGRAALQAVECKARSLGKKAVFLEWERKDAPRWVFSWYERNGYNEIESDGKATYALMKKQL